MVLVSGPPSIVPDAVITVQAAIILSHGIFMEERI
jgi:hypothetical protein